MPIGTGITVAFIVGVGVGWVGAKLEKEEKEKKKDLKEKK